MRRHRIGEAAGPRRRPCRLLRKRLRDAGSPHGSSDARWLLKITGRMTPETATGPSASPRCDIAVSNGDNGPFLAAVGYRSRLGWSSAAAHVPRRGKATCLISVTTRASRPWRRGLALCDATWPPTFRGCYARRPRLVTSSPKAQKARIFCGQCTVRTVSHEGCVTSARWRHYYDVIMISLKYYIYTFWCHHDLLKFYII